MKRYKVIKTDYRFRNIEKVFDNVVDAFLFIEDLEGQIILQEIDKDGNVVEEWKKWR